MLSVLKEEINSLYILLNEKRIDEIIAKFPELQPYIIKLEKLNTPIQYYDWILSQLKKTRRFDIVEKFVDTVKKFDFLKQHNQMRNPDISSYNHLQNLIDAVDLAEYQYKVKQEAKRAPEVQKIYNDENFLLLEPLNIAASCKYGKGTKWCISGEEDNKFKEYNEELGSRFLFCFDKKNNRKYAFEVDNEGDVYAYDELDQKISHLDLSKIFPYEAVQDAIMKFTGNDSLFDL